MLRRLAQWSWGHHVDGHTFQGTCGAPPLGRDTKENLGPVQSGSSVKQCRHCCDGSSTQYPGAPAAAKKRCSPHIPLVPVSFSVERFSAEVFGIIRKSYAKLQPHLLRRTMTSTATASGAAQTPFVFQLSAALGTIAPVAFIGISGNSAAAIRLNRRPVPPCSAFRKRKRKADENGPSHSGGDAEHATPLPPTAALAGGSSGGKHQLVRFSGCQKTGEQKGVSNPHEGAPGGTSADPLPKPAPPLFCISPFQISRHAPTISHPPGGSSTPGARNTPLRPFPALGEQRCPSGTGG